MKFQSQEFIDRLLVIKLYLTQARDMNYDLIHQIDISETTDFGMGSELIALTHLHTQIAGEIRRCESLIQSNKPEKEHSTDVVSIEDKAILLALEIFSKARK